jgi:hypothetical protein
MKYIKVKIKDAGAWTDLHTLENVDVMHQVVASIFGAEGTSHNACATSSLEYVPKPN